MTRRFPRRALPSQLSFSLVFLSSALAAQPSLPRELSLDLGADVRMEFVLIPAGKFLMGSPDHENGRGADEKQHEVAISRPFYMGKYEVTQAQYKALTDEKGKPVPSAALRLPQANVSWDAAQGCCDKLREKTSRKARLPTEAEWEYACRAGAPTPFNCGDKLTTTQANFNGRIADDSGQGDFASQVLAVGSFRPNAWGLYDMHGNLCEWCQDRYARDYYAASPSTDPPGPAAGGGRVVRGGGWLYRAGQCRAAFRFGRAPDAASSTIGFRVVLDVE